MIEGQIVRDEKCGSRAKRMSVDGSIPALERPLYID